MQVCLAVPYLSKQSTAASGRRRRPSRRRKRWELPQRMPAGSETSLGEAVPAARCRTYLPLSRNSDPTPALPWRSRSAVTREHFVAQRLRNPSGRCADVGPTSGSGPARRCDAGLRRWRRGPLCCGAGWRGWRLPPWAAPPQTVSGVERTQVPEVLPARRRDPHSWSGSRSALSLHPGHGFPHASGCVREPGSGRGAEEGVAIETQPSHPGPQ